jgi:hypothetical protein
MLFRVQGLISEQKLITARICEQNIETSYQVLIYFTVKQYFKFHLMNPRLFMCFTFHYLKSASEKIVLKL